jgi:hypothetical protein
MNEKHRTFIQKIKNAIQLVHTQSDLQSWFGNGEYLSYFKSEISEKISFVEILAPPTTDTASDTNHWIIRAVAATEKPTTLGLIRRGNFNKLEKRGNPLPPQTKIAAAPPHPYSVLSTHHKHPKIAVMIGLTSRHRANERNSINRFFTQVINAIAERVSFLLTTRELPSHLMRIPFELALLDESHSDRPLIESKLIKILEHLWPIYDLSRLASWYIFASGVDSPNGSFDHMAIKVAGAKQLTLNPGYDKNATVTKHILKTGQAEIISKFARHNITTFDHMLVKPACVVAAPVRSISGTVHGVIGVFSDRHDIDNFSFLEFIKLTSSVLAEALQRRIKGKRFSEAALAHDLHSVVTKMDESLSGTLTSNVVKTLTDSCRILNCFKDAYLGSSLPTYLEDCDPPPCEILPLTNLAITLALDGANKHDDLVDQVVISGNTQPRLLEAKYFAVVYNIVRNALSHGTATAERKVVIRVTTTQGRCASVIVHVDAPATETLNKGKLERLMAHGYDTESYVLWPRFDQRVARYGLRICYQILEGWRVKGTTERRGTLTLENSIYESGNCFAINFPIIESVKDE